MAARAVEVAERRISADKWPEYYDTKRARFIGKQARLYQTWSIAGYLVAKLLLDNPNAAKILMNEEDAELVNAFYCMIDANPRRKRSRKGLKSYIVWAFSGDVVSMVQCLPDSVSIVPVYPGCIDVSIFFPLVG